VLQIFNAKLRWEGEAEESAMSGYQSLFIVISVMLLLSTFLPSMPGRRQFKADDPTIADPE
jgi:hypothetical protein